MATAAGRAGCSRRNARQCGPGLGSGWGPVGGSCDRLWSDRPGRKHHHPGQGALLESRVNRSASFTTPSRHSGGAVSWVTSPPTLRCRQGSPWRRCPVVRSVRRQVRVPGKEHLRVGPTAVGGGEGRKARYVSSFLPRKSTSRPTPGWQQPFSLNQFACTRLRTEC